MIKTAANSIMPKIEIAKFKNEFDSKFKINIKTKIKISNKKILNELIKSNFE
tara:strand:- start:218 stop:373 length:156 start_codon:yes stop_codon:yes gene_type:complete